jgi:NAD(P)H-dependent flavin oxidoreductase YrpB (nitropropane dioxygenase family)
MKTQQEIFTKLVNRIPIWGYSPRGIPDPSLSVKISKAGGIGLINLEGLDPNQSQSLLNQSNSLFSSDHLWGIRVDLHETLNNLEFQEKVPIIICAFTPNSREIEKMRKYSTFLLSEVSYLEEAYEKSEWSDFFLVKGNEAGGVVGLKSSFILIQEFHKAGLPFVIQGGFGVYNISSAFIGGALGVVLEAQLYLLPECPLNSEFKEYIKIIDEHDFYLVNETHS